MARTAWDMAFSGLKERRVKGRGETPSLSALGQEEREAVSERLESLERQLQLHLIPADPNDDANLYLEIRAGTGGDEAAIFAGELELGGGSLAGSVQNFLLVSAFGFSLSYLVGFVPALLTGWVYAVLWQRNAGSATIGAMIAGAGFALLAPAVLSAAGAANFPPAFSDWPWFLLPGAIAAGVSVQVLHFGDRAARAGRRAV